MKQPPEPAAEVDAFIHRWESSGANERANYVQFLTELCNLLDVPHPEPSTSSTADNAYVFERDVTFDQGDGTTTTGRIDLYKRGCFVLEAKQGSDQERAEEQAAKALAPPTAKKSTKKKGTAVRGTKGWDARWSKPAGRRKPMPRPCRPAKGGRRF